jgi:hypothetical protein
MNMKISLFPLDQSKGAGAILSVLSMGYRGCGRQPRLLVAMMAAASFFATTQAAAPQQVSPASQSAADAENNGQDFTRPQSLFQVRYNYSTAPGSGSTKDTIHEVTTDTVTLRADERIDLSPQWVLALRADLPTVAKNPITSDNPAGNFLYGIGDVDAQAALIRTFDSRWAAGGGVRIIAPTGSADIGSGKWQSLFGVAVRYMLPEISQGSYFVPQVRYDQSFAGDPSKKNISNLQLMPTFNVALPNHWFVTFYPSADIRINYGDPVTGQTGRLFLPFDFLIGKTLSPSVAMSLELGLPIVKDYPVYNFKTLARLNVKF